MRVSTGLTFPLHLPLSSLPWFLVVIVAAILEDDDVNLLEVDVAHMEADRVPLRKDPTMQALWTQ